jgi:predicted NUDIX family NTP pyrophosphohydrolase
VYRFKALGLEVFLVHPGGPFWHGKDEGAWSIPKGEYGEGENPLAAAQREFKEETGHEVDGEFVPLGPIKQAGGKIVTAWALEADCDADRIKSNRFSMEWPPHSGRQAEFPEIDRAGWFSLPVARRKLLKRQAAFLDRLAEVLEEGEDAGSETSP